MEFKQIIQEIKAVKFNVIRVESDDYLEAVILRDQLSLLIEKLEKTFGKPVLSSSAGLPKEIEDIIGDFGGTREDQTLYFMKDKKYSYFAMLWPWSDEYHITIKVGLR